MSSGLEQRCAQFHETALGRATTNKPMSAAKEMQSLRKFLHRNQTQRFSEKASARLVDTIQLYIFRQQEEEEESKELREALLEDALKMPFTVFGTKQKSVMMKWLEQLRGPSKESGNAQMQQQEQHHSVLSVIDIVDGTQVSLMDDETGDCFDITWEDDNGVKQRLVEAFDKTDGVVSVKVERDSDGSVLRIVDVLPDVAGPS